MAMRVAVGQSPVATDEYLAFAAQLGASGVQFNTPDLPGEHPSASSARATTRRCA